MDSESIRGLVAEHTERTSVDAARYRYVRPAVAQIEAGLLHPPADHMATVLDAPRRTGKSIALRQLTARLRASDPARVHYCDLTDVRLRGVALQDLVHALVPEDQDPWLPRLLLLDEIHYSGDDWARQLKFAIDNFAARIAIADSAVALVRSSLRDELVGRINYVRMHPLTFAEWRDIRREQALPVAAEGDENALLRECREYLDLGGFPQHAAGDDLKAAHESLRNQVIAQAARDDIAQLRGLREWDRLERLLVSRLATSGAQLSTRQDAKHADVSEPTVRHWLQALIDTGLLWSLDGRVRSAGKYERTQSKLYAVDAGLIRACSLPVFGPNSVALLGRQVETAVAQALRVFCERKHARLSFFQTRGSEGRGEREVDFVVESDDGLRAFEVTSQNDRAKLPAIARVAKELGAEHVAVVSLRTRAEIADIDGLRVHLVPLHQLLLRLAEGALSW